MFKLRRGVRFHAKPPVNGRELTAEDVKFTFERMLGEVGSNASMYRAIAGSTTRRLGKFDSTVFGPLTPFLDPDNFLFGQYYAGEPRNRSHVKDPALDELLVRQRPALPPSRTTGPTWATTTAGASSPPGSTAECVALQRLAAGIG